MLSNVVVMGPAVVRMLSASALTVGREMPAIWYPTPSPPTPLVTNFECSKIALLLMHVVFAMVITRLAIAQTA
jgi:hypothetical protein